MCTRPRASVAVIVPAASSTAMESRNFVMAGPLMRGQSAGGGGTQSLGTCVRKNERAAEQDAAAALFHEVGLNLRARVAV